MEGYPEILAVTNLDENDEPTLDNGGLGSHEVVWHSDNSYVEVPPAGSLLYALEVPIDGGGNTSFKQPVPRIRDPAAGAQADDRGPLPGPRLEPQQRRGAAARSEAAEKPEDVEGPTHPIVRVHPHTGRRALYRRAPARVALELRCGPAERRERSLARRTLGAHATQPEFAWEHVWRDGDAVLWDNRCAMHYRTPIDPLQRRVMHRILIAGEPVTAPW